jgi:RNA polymerase sigma-70 factor (ECF subfamily)
MGDAGDVMPITEMLDEREHLLDIAHRSLGSGCEAQSVVDATYRRWYALSATERARIASPRSWLATIVGGIPLASADRHHDAGPGRADAERSAFGLEGAFDAAPGRKPECVGPADILRRALRAGRSRPTAPLEHDAIVRAVKGACAAQDAGSLASLLCSDAAAVFDGGGKVRAPVRPVHGRELVAGTLLTLLAPHMRTTVTAQSVNGRSGLVVRCDHRVAAVISLDVTDHCVAQVWAVLNPEKLRTWNQHVTSPPPPDRVAAPRRAPAGPAAPTVPEPNG